MLCSLYCDDEKTNSRIKLGVTVPSSKYATMYKLKKVRISINVFFGTEKVAKKSAH